MILITTEPIDPKRSFDMIASKSAGSVIFHYAVVKAQEGVAVTSPAGEDAFAACKSGISRLKKMRSIVKNEVRG